MKSKEFIVEKGDQIKLRDPRTAQIVRKAKNQYSGSADDDLSAIVSMFYNDHLDQEKDITANRRADTSQDKELDAAEKRIDANQKINRAQDQTIKAILQRLEKLEKGK